MIIPALDLFNKKIVRLYQGKYDQIKYYNIGIYELLEKYRLQGAKIIHLVDLTGAQNPDKKQLDLLINIIKNSPIGIQVGGGIRKKTEVEKLILAGAKRVVISSSAIKKEDDTKVWFKEFGANLIVLALDLKITENSYKEVKINAWKEFSGVSLEDIIYKYSEVGLKYVLCTDISRDGTFRGPNIDLYSEITTKFQNISFQSSGGISSVLDIYKLKRTKVQDVIIGRALLEKKFSLAEAIKCWQSE